MVNPGPKVPNDTEHHPVDLDPILDDLGVDGELDNVDFSDDGSEPESEITDVDELLFPEDSETSLRWDADPLLEDSESEASSLLDVPEDAALPFEVETEFEDGEIVLPWRTTGRWVHRDTDIPVQLDPSQPHSTWYAPKPDALSDGFTVQGVDINVSFTHVTADTELVVLGRDALDGRILISSVMDETSS